MPSLDSDFDGKSMGATIPNIRKPLQVQPLWASMLSLVHHCRRIEVQKLRKECSIRPEVKIYLVTLLRTLLFACLMFIREFMKGIP